MVSKINLKQKRRSRKAAKKRWTAKPKKKSVWYVQPLTDEPGSLLYFPHFLAYLCNCGDMDGLTELVKKHFHKKAQVHITGADSLVVNTTEYLSFLSIADVLFCDLLGCVYHTRVVGNQILSRLYYSYTDVAAMYQHTDSIVADPSLKKLFTGSRCDVLRRRLKLSSKDHELQTKLAPLIGSTDDLQMYYRADIIINFDEYTHKVLKMDYVYKIKAVGHNGERYRL